MACTSGPDDPVTVLNLTEVLPTSSRTEPVQPWVIQLGDSSRSTPVTGAGTGVGGQYVSYTCTNGEYVVGDINMSAPLWTVLLNSDASTTLLTGVVTKAWN